MIVLIKWVFLWSTRHDSFRRLGISWGCKNKCMRSRTKLREKWDKLAKSRFWFSSQIWLQSLRAQPQLKLLCCLLQIIAEAKNQPPLCSNNNGWAFSQTHSIMSLLSICFVLKRQSLTSKKKKNSILSISFWLKGATNPLPSTESHLMQLLHYLRWQTT